MLVFRVGYFLENLTICPQNFAYRPKNSISDNSRSRGHEQPTY